MNVFIPCRSGSKRIPNKNTRSFYNFKNGLIEIKIKQLSRVKEVENIFISTDDKLIIKIVHDLDISNVIIDKRPAEYCQDTTRTDDLILYATTILPDDDILWTHVTSPFVTAYHYSKIIEEYRNIDNNKFDSLITVSQLKNFIWNQNGAYNYNRNVNKWPFTQDLEVLYEINNAAFVCNKEVYKENKDRIGNSPKFFIMDQIRSIDIDTMDQFLLAEKVLKSSPDLI